MGGNAAGSATAGARAPVPQAAATHPATAIADSNGSGLIGLADIVNVVPDSTHAACRSRAAYGSWFAQRDRPAGRTRSRVTVAQ